MFPVRTHLLVSPLVMWTFIIAGVALLLALLPGVALFPRILAVSIVAAVYWLYFFVTALIANRTAPFSAASVEEVVTAGPYRYVRHPIYSADIVLAFGIFFAFPRVDVLIAVIYASAILILWMRLEERALLDRLGEAYRKYQKRTPMIIPHFRR